MVISPISLVSYEIPDSFLWLSRRQLIRALQAKVVLRNPQHQLRCMSKYF